MGFFGFVTRFLVLVFGVLVPARRTYNSLGNESLVNWAKYWIVYAWFLCWELVGDTFLNWLPLYVEFKLIAVLWLVMFAPQASVWVFDTILDPLVCRYLPQIDDILKTDKRYVLLTILNYASQLCIRLGSLVPIVSQMWRHPMTQTEQVVDTDEYTAPEVRTPQFQDVGLSNQNRLNDANVKDEAHSRPTRNSFSNAPMMSARKEQPKLSLPDLAAKMPVRNLSERGRDLVTNIAANTNDILFGKEDLLKSERRSIDIQNRATLIPKDTRRRQ